MGDGVSNLSSSKFGEFAFAVTPKELCLIAQRLRAKRATLGEGLGGLMYPNGVPSSAVLEGRNPFRVDDNCVLSPRVARMRGQPWAMRRNSFGVKTCLFKPKLETTDFGFARRTTAFRLSEFQPGVATCRAFLLH